MVQDTCASRLLGVDGLTVTEVEDDEAGVRVVYAVTSADVVAGCPTCQAPSQSPKCWTTALSRDLDIGGRRCVLVWCKRRWYCRCRDCPATSFTETLPQIPARARVTGRLRQSAGAAVCDGGRRARRALADITHVSEGGLPFVGPEIVLLFKARGLRDQDEQDFRDLAPRLSAEPREWLMPRLSPPGGVDHPWLATLLDLRRPDFGDRGP